MSDEGDEPDADGEENWRDALLDAVSADRFRRFSGARKKTRDLTFYVGDRVELAYPDRHRGRRFRCLPPPIRAFLNIQFVVGLVGNGGVEYLLTSGLPPGGRFGEVVRDFRLAGATDAAERLAEVYRLFPRGMPQRDHCEREATVTRLFEQYEDVFDRASQAIWDHEDAVCRAAATRVRLAPHLLRPKKRKPDSMNRNIHYLPL